MKKILLYLTFSLFSITAFSLGNPLFSPQKIDIFSSIQIGMYGSKDFLYEDLTFNYSFKSGNLNRFTLRFKELILFPGLFTNNLYRTGAIFALSSGFEYFIKLFSPENGISFFFDTGFGFNTVYFATGAGVGNRFTNGIFITIEYLHNTFLSSDIDLYVRILKYLSIRGNVGFYMSFYDDNSFPYIKTGLFPGFHISEYFKLNCGGGFTVSESFIFGFYTSLYITTTIPF